MTEFLNRKGYMELVSFLNSTENKKAEAKDIQNHLQTYNNFTPGQVTGTINRACASGIIRKTDRAMYELNIDATVDSNEVGNSINVLIADIIDTACAKIETIAGQRILNLSASDLTVIQNTLNKLKSMRADLS